MSKGEKLGRPYPGVSVTTKLLFYFLIFMTLMLVVLFVFQVMLLNVFYRHTKMTEMEHVQYYVDSGMGKSDAIKATAKDRGVGKSDIYNLVMKK